MKQKDYDSINFDLEVNYSAFERQPLLYLFTIHDNDQFYVLTRITLTDQDTKTLTTRNTRDVELYPQIRETTQVKMCDTIFS